MKDINVINFFEENNINFSSNFNLGVTNLPVSYTHLRAHET